MSTLLVRPLTRAISRWIIRGLTEWPMSVLMDVDAPLVTFASFTTNKRKPALSGSVNDPEATIRVSVGGYSYNAVNNANGTWSIAEGVMSNQSQPNEVVFSGSNLVVSDGNIIVSSSQSTPQEPVDGLVDGMYAVVVTATDAFGNTSKAYGTIYIDATAPAITIHPLATNNRRPALSGTVDDAEAVIKLTVGGVEYPVANPGDGTWTLPANTVAVLADGSHPVTVTATDTLDNVGTAQVSILIDATAPTVSVSSISVNVRRPGLSGLVNDATATVVVTINGSQYNAVNSGQGTWSIAPDTVDSLTDGSYVVTVKATDLYGNIGNGSGTVVVDATAPTLTFVDQTIYWDKSTLTGQVNDDTATVLIISGGLSYSTTVNQGEWTSVNIPFAVGNNSIQIQATDAFGNTSSITRNVYRFDPQLLFTGSTKGFFYDNNDLATMYQDTMGTVPSGFDQNVALQFDKSLGLTLGPNLVTNGDFGAGTSGWNVYDGNASVTDNVLTITETGGGVTARTWQSISTTIGKLYKVQGTVLEPSPAGAGIGISNTSTSTGSVLANAAGIGVLTFYFIATRASHALRLVVSSTKSGNTAKFSDISVNEVMGNHRTQLTASLRPILRRMPILGPELVTNGRFDTDLSTWSAEAGWSWVDGKAYINGDGTLQRLARYNLLTIGKTYLIRFTVDVTGGGLGFENNSGNAVASASSGKVSAIWTADKTHLVFKRTTGSIVGTLDNVSVREVTGYSDKYYLDYDSLDDVFTTTLPTALGSACTVVRASPQEGMILLENQTIGTSYSSNADAAALIVIDRALTVDERDKLLAWILQRTPDITQPDITFTDTQVIKRKPAITGSVSEPYIDVKVTIGGVTHNAIVAGYNWSVPENTIADLADGANALTITATDQSGNVSVKSGSITYYTGATLSLNFTDQIYSVWSD